MNEADIMQKELTQAKRDCAFAVRDTIHELIRRELDVLEPEKIGSDTGATTPLGPARVRVKRLFGGVAPSVPRLMSGDLLSSMLVQPLGQSDSMLFVGGDETKAVTQQLGSREEWVDEEGTTRKGTRARPFFGVTDDALDRCEDIIAKADQRITEKFASTEDYGPIIVRI